MYSSDSTELFSSFNRFWDPSGQSRGGPLLTCDRKSTTGCKINLDRRVDAEPIEIREPREFDDVIFENVIPIRIQTIQHRSGTYGGAHNTEIKGGSESAAFEYGGNLVPTPSTPSGNYNAEIQSNCVLARHFDSVSIHIRGIVF
jgi:hypothetical protein